MSVWRIHEIVREGRITAEQGARLLELRREIAWRRKPRIVRAMWFLWRMLWA